ncbi:MAG: S41 family peptidase [Chloroflexota bacterium]
MSADNKSPLKPAGRITSGALVIVVALLFGLGMGAAGFLAGRAMVIEQHSPTAVASMPAAAELAGQVESIPDEQVDNSPVVVAVTVEPTLAPSPLSATPIPTSPPTVTPEPTPEPTQPDTSNTNVIEPPAGSPLEGVEFTTFYEVWDLIAGEFDGSVPPANEMLESIITGSLETLDDNYTRYVSPDVAERMRQDEDGAVEGIGAFVIENDEGLFEIVRPIDGQPADLAGVKAGDVLIEVDGQPVLDLSFDEVILLVRGPQGTSVDLKFVREGEEEPVEFTIIRTRFEVPVVESEILPAEMTGGATIGYIRLTEFNRSAEEKLLEALADIMAQNATGLIFDLRDNPGGFLDQSVAVADAFLPQGVALFERNNRGLDETFRTGTGDIAETIPLVVLVNSGSASASEIVAGAIQDRGRAVLIGETTFGKGSVQQIHTLSDGSELRVTIARWYTPNNNTIDGQGITPDIEVENPEDLGGPEDGQLMRAIEFLLTGQ